MEFHEAGRVKSHDDCGRRHRLASTVGIRQRRDKWRDTRPSSMAALINARAPPALPPFGEAGVAAVRAETEPRIRGQGSRIVASHCRRFGGMKLFLLRRPGERAGRRTSAADHV